MKLVVTIFSMLGMWACAMFLVEAILAHSNHGMVVYGVLTMLAGAGFKACIDNL